MTQPFARELTEDKFQIELLARAAFQHKHLAMGSGYLLPVVLICKYSS